MKTLKSICTTMLVLTAAAVGVGAQALRTDINPALIYGRAFLAAPNLAQADSDYLFTNGWNGQKFPERFTNLVKEYDNEFELVCAAAQAKVPCDWGIDMSPGPMTLLPALSRAKSVAVTARLRVMWHLQNGRQTQACDELLGAYTLARNVSRDGTLISSLVQMAMENIVYSSIAANYGRFSPENLKRLVDGMDAAPARSAVASCIPTEKAFFSDWAKNKIVELQKKYPGNDAKVLEEVHQFMSFDSPEEGETNSWPRLLEAAGGTSGGILKLLQDGELIYDKIVAFLKLPYSEYQSQEQAFVDELEKSTNPIVAKTVPGFVKSRQKEFRTQATQALVRAAVEFKLHGDAGLKSVIDPCGNGPFAFKRFEFEGVDRGFQLTSAFNMSKNMAVLIFVEKEGPPFQVDGNYPGRALPTAAPKQ
jgi:hypothetical protein